MSLFGEYIKEREGIDIVEDQNGFATYKITGDTCYIIDIYVRPGERKSHVASKFANEIVEVAKAANCKYLTGSVAPGTNGATASLKVLLAYGFELAAIDHAKNLILFYKEI